MTRQVRSIVLVRFDSFKLATCTSVIASVVVFASVSLFDKTI